MDNYPDNYKISTCEKCCEYNDKSRSYLELKLDFSELFLHHFRNGNGKQGELQDRTACKRYSEMIIKLNPEINNVIFIENNTVVYNYNLR